MTWFRNGYDFKRVVLEAMGCDWVRAKDIHSRLKERGYEIDMRSLIMRMHYSFKYSDIEVRKAGERGINEYRRINKNDDGGVS